MYTYEMYIKKENGLNSLNGSSGIVEVMTGAYYDNINKKECDGKEGLVPMPTYADKTRYLRGDGYWTDINLAERAKKDNKGNIIDETYALRNIYGTTVNCGRKSDSPIGTKSFAFGDQVTASGQMSQAYGLDTMATALMSCAKGRTSIANKICSHAYGMNTISNNYMAHAYGKYNVEMIEDSSFEENLGTAFVIGNGESETSRSNAFSVMFDGKVKAASTITASTTADYAEFFEWEDENPHVEDRVGKFVTLRGDKIVIATSNEEYILGIISGQPFVLGNGDCDVWTGMWLRDDFNRIIYESAPKMEIDENTGAMKEVFDEDGNLVYEGKRRKLNPDYDPSQKYISRFDRPEWAPVGMLGVLSVIQDGTCEVNGYCCCNGEGIATACDRNTIGAYRVIRKISDQIVRVIFR